MSAINYAIRLTVRLSTQSICSADATWQLHTQARASGAEACLCRGYFPAFAMGFGTSSSAATMPVTMECGMKLKCRPSIVKFVIPLGTNINRDGAALYEAASVLFIAQVRSVINMLVLKVSTNSDCKLVLKLTKGMICCYPELIIIMRVLLAAYKLHINRRNLAHNNVDSLSHAGDWLALIARRCFGPTAMPAASGSAP